MFLKKNINALRAGRLPELAELLENYGEEQQQKTFRIVKGKTGQEILYMKNEQGHFIQTQSLVDPMRYNERKYSQEQMKDASFIVVAGLACEHELLYALRNKRDNAFIVVIEPSIELIRVALDRVDCSALISDGKFGFIYHKINEINGYAEIFLTRPHVLFMATHPYVMHTKRAELQNSEYFMEAIKIFMKRAMYKRLLLGNSIEDSLIGWRNIVSNLDHQIEAIQFNSLKGTYAKKPAVVVATGPSLDKNIEQLKELEGKALIIATESAIVPLTNHNIEPDAIIVLERIPESYDYHFKGREFKDKTVLVALTMLDPRILQEWENEKVLIFREGETMNLWFKTWLNGQDGLSAGESVSTMGFDFADYLGCEPICFVGLDLAYSAEGVSHSKESSYIAEQHSSNQNYVNYIQLNERIPVEGINGETVFTNELWLRFKDWLEVRMEKQPGFYIDATEGGAYVKGTTVKTLREVIQLCESEEVRPLRDVVRGIRQQQTGNSNELLLALTHIKEEVYKMRSNTIELLRKMRKVLKKQKKIIEDLQINTEGNTISSDVIEVVEESRAILNRHFQYEHATTLFFLQSIYASLYVKLNNIGVINTKRRLTHSIVLEQQYFIMAEDTLRHQVLTEYKTLEMKVNGIMQKLEGEDQG